MFSHNDRPSSRRVSLRSRIDLTLAGPRPRRQGPVADRNLRPLICVLHVVPPTANRIAGTYGKDGADPDRSLPTGGVRTCGDTSSEGYGRAAHVPNDGWGALGRRCLVRVSARGVRRRAVWNRAVGALNAAVEGNLMQNREDAGMSREFRVLSRTGGASEATREAGIRA